MLPPFLVGLLRMVLRLSRFIVALIISDLCTVKTNTTLTVKPVKLVATVKPVKLVGDFVISSGWVFVV